MTTQAKDSLRLEFVYRFKDKNCPISFLGSQQSVGIPNFIQIDPILSEPIRCEQTIIKYFLFIIVSVDAYQV